MADEIRNGGSKVRVVRLFGQRDDAGAWQIRDFLKRSVVEFQWIELSTEEDCRRELGLSDLKNVDLPVVELPDGTRLFGPILRDVADRLGFVTKPKLRQYDLSIYGAGPAGLSAAVYAASEGLKTVVIERLMVGGQAGTSTKIENYLGFPEGISGAELAKRAREQASRFGAEILMLREGVRGEFQPGKGIGYLADGTKIVAQATICATGVTYRRLNLPNEEPFRGVGVYYGAGASEASLCVNDHVFVVGGGNSAGQAVMHFSRYARKVSMVIRGDGLKETLSQYLIDRILASPRVEVLTHTGVTALDGDQVLRAITLTNNQTGQQQT